VISGTLCASLCFLPFSSLRFASSALLSNGYHTHAVKNSIGFLALRVFLLLYDSTGSAGLGAAAPKYPKISSLCYLRLNLNILVLFYRLWTLIPPKSPPRFTHSQISSNSHLEKSPIAYEIQRSTYIHLDPCRSSSYFFSIAGRSLVLISASPGFHFPPQMSCRIHPAPGSTSHRPRSLRTAYSSKAYCVPGPQLTTPPAGVRCRSGWVSYARSHELDQIHTEEPPSLGSCVGLGIRV
jgi:hypothetical protein